MSIKSYVKKNTATQNKLPLLLGGGILIYYRVDHSAMPDKLSLGDGIWLISIAAASGGIIMMGVAFYAAMGCCILGLIRKTLLRSVPSENESQRMKDIIFIFKEHIPAFSGVISSLFFWGFICLLLYITGNSDWIIFLSGALLLCPVIITLVLVKMKLNKVPPSFGFTPEKAELPSMTPEKVRGALLYFAFSVDVYASLLGFISPVVDTTMRLLSVRQENVTLYVKSP